MGSERKLDIVLDQLADNVLDRISLGEFGAAASYAPIHRAMVERHEAEYKTLITALEKLGFGGISFANLNENAPSKEQLLERLAAEPILANKLTVEEFIALERAFQIQIELDEIKADIREKVEAARTSEEDKK